MMQIFMLILSAIRRNKRDWKIDFYEFDTALKIKGFAANTNERIAWLDENYILIRKTKQ